MSQLVKMKWHWKLWYTVTFRRGHIRAAEHYANWMLDRARKKRMEELIQNYDKHWESFIRDYKHRMGRSSDIYDKDSI